MPDIMDLFPDRVMPEPNSGCWLWLGASQDGGYGSFGRNGKSVSAHRFSLEVHFGRSLRHRKMALHKCDNKLCVNPAHLYEGTKRENALDAYARGQMRNIWHPSGEKHPLARLTREQIAEIRSINGRARHGQISEMAGRFGVSCAAIHDVRQNRSWVNL